MDLHNNPDTYMYRHNLDNILGLMNYGPHMVLEPSMGLLPFQHQ